MIRFDRNSNELVVSSCKDNQKVCDDFDYSVYYSWCCGKYVVHIKSHEYCCSRCKQKVTRLGNKASHS